jgi:hypothetical protein
MFAGEISECASHIYERQIIAAAKQSTKWQVAFQKMVYRDGFAGRYQDERSPFSYDRRIGVDLTSEIEEGAMTMAHFVGLDVSVKETAVCVVDEVGEVVLEQKVPTEQEDIIALLTSIGEAYGRVGIEATIRAPKPVLRTASTNSTAKSRHEPRLRASVSTGVCAA